jgi:hypothetical protein
MPSRGHVGYWLDSIGQPGQGEIRRDEEWSTMTSTKESQSIAEALAIIDRGLNEMQRRDLVSTDEVANLLLDVRVLLSPWQDDDLLN